jgi:predicted transport protein
MDKYLENVKKQTGKTWQEFKVLAEKAGLATAKHGEILSWLKKEYALGHGHANAVTHMILQGDGPQETLEEATAKHFIGAKELWRKDFDALAAKLLKFGSDVKYYAGGSYITFVRGDKKFAIVSVTKDRFDIGIKLKGQPAQGRFEESGKWNPMVTHRIQITDPKQIDSEVMEWLRRGYEGV